MNLAKYEVNSGKTLLVTLDWSLETELAGNKEGKEFRDIFSTKSTLVD